MKFGKHLEEHVKQQWKLYYLDYHYLKTLIKDMVATINAGTHSKQDAEKQFTSTVDCEIKRVNDFFVEVYNEIQDKIITLRKILKTVCI